MGLEVIVGRENLGGDEFLLEDSHEVEEIFWGVVADIVYLIWWDREAVLTILLLRGMLHDTNHTFYDIVDIGEVAFAVAIIEDLYGLAFTEFVGKSEICHVRTTGRTVDGKEAETCAWDVVEFAVGVSHEFVALLCGSIKRDWVVHLVVGRVWHFFVGTINGRRRSVYEVFDTLIV